MGKVEGRVGRVLVANLPRGSDLLGSLESLAGESGIQGGFFTAIGAVRRAAFSYYDQSSHQYVVIKKDEGLEITSCSGNFGVFEGRPRIHCHVTFCDRQGRAIGGHLLPGTEVFVGEVHLTEVDGVKLERRMDPETGIAMLDF
jgi:predicted DNA-binding protein with PD1-like motif